MCIHYYEMLKNDVVAMLGILKLNQTDTPMTSYGICDSNVTSYVAHIHKTSFASLVDLQRMLVLFIVRCCFNSQGIVIISIIKPLSF